MHGVITGCNSIQIANHDLLTIPQQSLQCFSESNIFRLDFGSEGNGSENLDSDLNGSSHSILIQDEIVNHEKIADRASFPRLNKHKRTHTVKNALDLARRLSNSPEIRPKRCYSTQSVQS